MNTLDRCATIIDGTLTDTNKLEGVFDCIKTHGFLTHDELTDAFVLVRSLVGHENAGYRLHYYLMGAQAEYIASCIGVNAPDTPRLLEEFYTELLYEHPEYMWFEHMKHHGLLQPIESKDWSEVFDNCRNAEKLAAVLSENLFDADEEIFGVQSWLTTSLAQSANVFALRAFGQSLKHVLSHLNDDEFCSTVQTLIEEMTQYGLYTYNQDSSKHDFFVELLDHTSIFNQGLPDQARLNHKSMLQRLDLLLHDVNALDGSLMQYVAAALQEPWASEIVVEHMGAYVSDLWANCGQNQIPDLASAGSMEWPAPVFDHFLPQLSTDERIRVLYMGLGRLRSKNTIVSSSQPQLRIAHLPWMEQSWNMRRVCLSEAKWEEYEGDNMCNYLVPVRAANQTEEWISLLMERLEISAVDLAQAVEHPISTVSNDLPCTSWPQDLVRDHPLVQRELIQRNVPDTQVLGVKKM